MIGSIFLKVSSKLLSKKFIAMHPKIKIWIFWTFSILQINGCNHIQTLNEEKIKLYEINNKESKNLNNLLNSYQKNILENYLISGKKFKHRIIKKKSDHNTSNFSKILHVYLGGDGNTWMNQHLVSKKPDPKKVLALDLYLKDENNSGVYLGRPCHFVDQKECHYHFWTFGRYHPEVISSMVMALENYIQGKKIDKIRLIGYSGGAAIAALMLTFIHQEAALNSALLNNIKFDLVTIAGNLNPRAWVEYHGYLPLTLSLDPMFPEKKLSNQRQNLTEVDKTFQIKSGLHFAGEKDSNILPKMVSSYTKKFNHKIIILPEYNHQCCWIENWPILLDNYIEDRDFLITPNLN